MEKWTDKVMASNVLDTENTLLIKVSDCVDTIEEQEVYGAEPEMEEEWKAHLMSIFGHL